MSPFYHGLFSSFTKTCLGVAHRITACYVTLPFASDLRRTWAGARRKEVEMSDITRTAIFYSMMIITLNMALAIAVMGHDFMLP